jgi:hypothetical protein
MKWLLACICVHMCPARAITSTFRDPGLQPYNPASMLKILRVGRPPRAAMHRDMSACRCSLASWMQDVAGCTIPLMQHELVDLWLVGRVTHAGTK